MNLASGAPGYDLIRTAGSSRLIACHVPPLLMPQRARLAADAARCDWSAFKSHEGEFRARLPVFAEAVGERLGAVDGEAAAFGASVEALAHADRLSSRHLERANARLLGSPRSQAGLRRGLVWMRAPAAGSSQYVAPAAEHLPRLVTDLLAFVDDRQIPPVPRALVALLQCLRIHPFRDGNGRTARALFGAVLWRGAPSPLALDALVEFWKPHRALLHDCSYAIQTRQDHAFAFRTFVAVAVELGDAGGRRAVTACTRTP